MLVGKFSLKIKWIGIQFVVQCWICPGVTFIADNPVEILNEHLSLLVLHYVPTNKDKLWFDDQYTHAFGLKQKAHIRWTRDHSLVNREEFVYCQVRANETYSEAKRQFSVRNRDVLMNAQLPHK